MGSVVDKYAFLPPTPPNFFEEDFLEHVTFIKTKSNHEIPVVEFKTNEYILLFFKKINF